MQFKSLTFQDGVGDTFGSKLRLYSFFLSKYPSASKVTVDIL